MDLRLQNPGEVQYWRRVALRRQAYTLVLSWLNMIPAANRKQLSSTKNWAPILLGYSPADKPIGKGTWEEPHPSVSLVIGIPTTDSTSDIEAML